MREPAGSTVTVETPDGPMRMYDAVPLADDQPEGGVIVCQEAWGVNAHIEDVALRLARAGYRAVAPHLFHRSGDPELAYDDLNSIMPHMQALTADGLLADMDAAVSYLGEAAELGSPRVAVIGFCMGGSVATFTAARRRIGAAVSFYGGGVADGRFGMPPLAEVAKEFQTPWLGLYGGQDQGIPVEQAEALRQAAKQAPVPTDLVLYPEAAHGFHCDARPSAYHQASAEDAWNRTLDWLAEHVARGR